MISKIINFIRGIFAKMVPTNDIKVAYKERNIPDMGGFFEQIEYWSDIYSGGGKWRTAKKGGIKGGIRQVKALNTAKFLCNELSNLVFSEQVTISISDDSLQGYVNKVLNENQFWSNFSSLLENSFALGGGVIKCFIENGNVKLDYVPANRFYPTSWDNRLITGGVFISKTVRGKYYYTLFESHDYKNGVETVENRLYRSLSKDEVGYRTDLSELYEGLQETSEIKGVSAPLFAYIKPNLSNNIDFDSPLGISVYSGALDTLESLDIVFDSLQREFILGKKRIIVPTTAIETEYDDDGNARRYFDTSDEVYQAFKADDKESLKIEDNTVELRIEQHIAGINALLNILCAQTGLSAGSLSFDNVQGIKTATEIISQNSKTYRTIRGHQNIITEALEQITNAIITLGAGLSRISKTEYEIAVKFDDSIITDKNADIDNVIKLSGAGLMSKKDAVIKIFGYDEGTAAVKVEEIAAENRVSANMIDFKAVAQ